MANPISIDALRVLDAIARKGTFAAAAETLFRVPSAVSYTIHKLEEDLDVTLFDRSGHRAQLTPAGHYLLEEGRELLRAADQLAHTTRQVAQGWETRLRIAVDTLLPVRAAYPSVNAFLQESLPVEVQVREEVLAGSWDSLQARRADLLLGVSTLTRPAGDFRLHPLGRLDFTYALAPDHPLAQLPEPLTEEQVSRYPAVVVADSSRHLQPGSSGIFARQRSLTVPSIEAKIEAQQAGLGVGWLPRRRIQHLLEEGSLVSRRIDTERPALTLYMACHSNDNGKALRWFWEYFQTHGEDFAPWLTPVAESQEA